MNTRKRLNIKSNPFKIKSHSSSRCTFIFAIFLTCTIVITSCIEPYFPTFSRSQTNKYVVIGQVLDIEGYQTVKISLTSQLENPTSIPLTDCSTKITDSRGKEYLLTEYEPGSYRVWMNSSDLTPGVEYKLNIVTPAGVNIVSEFDKMNECPNVDSVYYEREDLPTKSTSVFIQGIQFYIDLNATNTDTRYFRWDIEETYEIHAEYPKEWYYDGSLKRIVPPDYSNFVCWRTQKVKNVFTLSTQNLKVNSYKQHPLHFVDNTSSRLIYCYSLLIEQYSLSEQAYSYWEQLRINSNETGGLYEKQPLPMTGNLKNLTNPDEQILGMFYASSIKKRRIFVNHVDNLTIDYQSYCSPQILVNGLRDIEPREYPGYLIFINHAPLLLQEFCVDCRSYGGVTTKPDYWPY
jgi:hypothetical protein